MPTETQLLTGEPVSDMIMIAKWLLLVIGLWLLISPIALAMLHYLVPGFRSVSSQLAALSDRIAAVGLQMLTWVGGLFLLGTAQHRVKIIVVGATQDLLRSVREIQTNTKNTRDETLAHAIETKSSIGDLSVALDQFTGAIHGPSAVQPSAIKDVLVEEEAHAVSSAKFWVSLIILLALIAVNTVLLQKYLGEVIETELVLFDVYFDLGLALGLFFTIVECAFGAIIFFTNATAKQLSIGRFLANLLWGGCVTALCFFEYVLYSALGREMQLDVASLIPASVSGFLNANNWLGTFGVAIVLGLVGTAHMVMSGWQEMSRKRIAKSLKRLLEDSLRASKSISSTLGQIETRALALREKVSECIAFFLGNPSVPEGAASAFSRRVDSDLRMLETAVDRVNDAGNVQIAIAPDEESATAFFASMLKGLVLIVCVAAVSLALFSTLVRPTVTESAGVIFCGLILVSCSFVAGFYSLGTAKVFLREDGSVVGEHRLMGVSRFVLIGVFLAAVIVASVMFYRISGSQVSWALIGLLFSLVLSFVLGVNLPAIALATWYVLCWFASRLFAIALAVVRLTVLAIRVVVDFLEPITRFLAAPLLLVLHALGLSVGGGDLVKRS